MVAKATAAESFIGEFDTAENQSLSDEFILIVVELESRAEAEKFLMKALGSGHSWLCTTDILVLASAPAEIMPSKNTDQLPVL